MPEPEMNLAVKELRQSLDLLSEILAKRSPLLPGQMNFAQRLTQQKKQVQTPFEVVRFDLSVARNKEAFRNAGTIFYVIRTVNAAGTDVSGSMSIQAVQNNQVRDVPLVAGQGIKTEGFDVIFVTNTAQADTFADILVVQDDFFQFIDNRLATSITSISSLTSISGTIAGLTALPSGATAVRARARSAAAGAASTTMYTVTSGKTLHITSAWVGQQNDSGGEFVVELVVHDSGGTFQFSVLGCVGRSVNDRGNESNAFPYHILVPAGYTVRMRKQVAGADTTNGTGIAAFEGYEL